MKKVSRLNQNKLKVSKMFKFDFFVQSFAELVHGGWTYACAERVSCLIFKCSSTFCCFTASNNYLALQNISYKHSQKQCHNVFASGKYMKTRHSRLQRFEGFSFESENSNVGFRKTVLKFFYFRGAFQSGYSLRFDHLWNNSVLFLGVVITLAEEILCIFYFCFSVYFRSYER